MGEIKVKKKKNNNNSEVRTMEKYIKRWTANWPSFIDFGSQDRMLLFKKKNLVEAVHGTQILIYMLFIKIFF